MSTGELVDDGDTVEARVVDVDFVLLIVEAAVTETDAQSVHVESKKTINGLCSPVVCDIESLMIQ